MKMYLIFSFLFSAIATAQTQQIPYLLDEFMSITDEKEIIACSAQQKDTKVAIAKVHCECDVDKESIKKENYTSFQFADVKLEDIPQSLKQHIPGEVFEKPSKGIRLLISIPNDNKMVGLWGIAFGHENDGDDFGYTHGMQIDVSKTFKNNMTYTLSAGSKLYTKRLAGTFYDDNNRRTIPQHFTNENMVKFVVDNIHKNKTLYYKLGVGWIQLDSKNVRKGFQASGQQTEWHKKITFYSFDSVADGDEVKNGINMDSFIGLQKNLLLGSSCRVRFFGESGAHLSSLDDDFFKLQAGSMFYFQKPDSNWGVKAGANMNSKFHTGGNERKTDFSLGYDTKSVGVQLVYEMYNGDLRNHAKYNLPNYKNGTLDPMLNIKLNFMIGSGASKERKLRKKKKK